MIERLRGKKILVTGGAGFIGSHIVDKLVECGAEVVVLDNLVAGKLENLEHNLGKIEFVKGDITDEACLAKVLKGVEMVSHQAALRSVPKSVQIPQEYHRVNVSGTLDLFLKAKEAGVRRITFASSSSIYGERSNFPERETDLAKPVSPYAATKVMGEKYAYVFSKLYGLEVVSLRYFNVFGPRQSLENEYAVVIPKFITCLLDNQRPPIYGNGKQERDFSYIDNVVEANLLALTKEGIAGEVFNIASGTPESVNKLLAVLNKIMSKRIKAEYLAVRPGDVLKTHADISKAKKVLSWKPKVNFYQGLERTVAWFKKR